MSSESISSPSLYIPRGFAKKRRKAQSKLAGLRQALKKRRKANKAARKARRK